MRPADKLQVKAAIIPPLLGLARSKQDPINRGHGAQYLYCPPPAAPSVCCSIYIEKVSDDHETSDALVVTLACSYV